MLFLTLSPFIHHCHLTLQAILCLLRPLHLFLPTTSQVPVLHWPSTCLQTHKHCHIICLHWEPLYKGCISMTCWGLKSRGAEWCSTPREYYRSLSFYSEEIYVEPLSKPPFFNCIADEHTSVHRNTLIECIPTMATDTISMCHKLCLPILASLSREQHGQCRTHQKISNVCFLVSHKTLVLYWCLTLVLDFGLNFVFRSGRDAW